MVGPWRSWNLQVSDVGTGSRYAWLETVIEVHGPAMRRMLRRMLGNEDDALEAYQECVCQLARRSGDPGAPGPVRCAAGYAHRTAANLALETIRGRRRRAAHWDRVVATVRSRRDTQANEPNPTNEANGTHPLDRLRRAVHALPKHLREVIVLRDLSELPYNRVAGILGIRPTTARVYRRQAIIRLERMLSAAETGN